MSKFVTGSYLNILTLLTILQLLQESKIIPFDDKNVIIFGDIFCIYTSVLFYTRSHLAGLKVLLYSHFNSKVYLGIYVTFSRRRKEQLCYLLNSLVRGKTNRSTQHLSTKIHLDVHVIKGRSFQCTEARM